MTTPTYIIILIGTYYREYNSNGGPKTLNKN